MFNQSRRKIILTIMASITLMFAVTLAVILLVSFREIRERNQTTLEHYVASYTLKQTTSTNKSQSLNDTVPKEDKTDLQLATFYAVALREDGTVLRVDNAGKSLFTEEELVKLAKQLISENKTEGQTATLSYMIANKDGYMLVAFMDNTVSEGGLKTMLRNVVAVGSIAIILLFVISIYLSKQIIKPLAENDQKQKQFISDASHELKTPLAVISANAEMLAKEIGPNEWLSNIQYENQRMDDLVKQLLHLSRAENAEVVMEKVDLSRIVTGEALAFESLAFEQGKALQYDVKENIQITGNQSQLTQLTSILIDNAIRHATGNEIDLELSQQGYTVILSVENEGKTISLEDQHHLFDRFYQVDKVRNSEGHHYGLGLSIAKAITQNHGGNIEVSCHNNKIKFKVTLFQKFNIFQSSFNKSSV